jgi:hypothetical protein
MRATMPDDVHLTFQNGSETSPPPHIVIWKPVVASASADWFHTTWQMIVGCAYDWRYPFQLSRLHFAFEDAYGNHATPRPVRKSAQYILTSALSFPQELGDESDGAVAFKNATLRSHRVLLFSGGRLVARSRSLASGDAVRIIHRNVIRLGVLSEVFGPRILTPEMLSRCSAEIDLRGVQRASILMLGGGYGPRAVAYRFLLTNTAQSTARVCGATMP